MSEDLAAWAQSRPQSVPAVQSPADGRMTPIELKVVSEDVERIEAYTAEVADHMAAHLLEHTGPDPVFEVYDRDADMPALDLPGAPLPLTARWWRAVAYQVAEDVPGLRIVEAPKSSRQSASQHHMLVHGSGAAGVRSGSLS